MTRDELIEKIKAYVLFKGWHSSAFAIDGSAADFLLCDASEYNPPTVLISLSLGNCHAACDEEYSGLRFIALVNHGGWASYATLPNTPEFVVSTRARIERRMKTRSYV